MQEKFKVEEVENFKIDSVASVNIPTEESGFKHVPSINNAEPTIITIKNQKNEGADLNELENVKNDNDKDDQENKTKAQSKLIKSDPIGEACDERINAGFIAQVV